MNAGFRTLGRALVMMVGLAAGVGLLILFVTSRQTPERIESTASAIDVRVIEARGLGFRVEARGYGLASPAETWQAIANVAGRVVERHPDLESGALLPEGTLLVALDPSRYRLAVTEVEAELDSLASESDLLDVEERNTSRLLALERERLTLAEQELERIERLAASGTVSTSQRDEQRRGVLAQRQAVAALENSLALMPSRRAVLTAQRERARVRLAQAHRDLEDTRFVAPYDLRLEKVEVEMHQFVAAGQRMFQAENLEVAEVEAHIPIDMMRRLLGAVARPHASPDSLDMTDRIAFDAVAARLELAGIKGIGWDGRLVRVASGLDPVTRTVRAMIRVDHPYRDARPPDRPPLQRGMYIRVLLSAKNPAPLLVVPAGALHQGEIHLADSENRLRRRKVEVAFEQKDLAVIAAGIEPGERVVVDDLPAAIEGAALAPRRDRDLEHRMEMLAAGRQP